MNNSVCLLDADYTFGPRVDPSCRTFDFTLLFEQSIFSIGPAALFLLVSTARFWTLKSKSRVAQGGLLHRLKLVGRYWFAHPVSG